MTSAGRLSLLLVGLISIVVAGFMLVRPPVERYLASDGYCARCHAESTQHLGRHQQTSCQSCHVAPKGHTLPLLLRSFAGKRWISKHGKVIKASCRSCHEKNERNWNALAQTIGHASHSIDQKLVDCIQCHSRTLHGKPAAAAERCESCHAEMLAKRKDSAGLDCQRCHVFSAGETVVARNAASNQVAWGKEITGANVHGSADCRLCHNPHRAEREKDLAAAITCTDCHRGDLARSVQHAPENHHDCLRCHRPHGLRAELKTACAICHQAPRVRGEKRDPGVPDDMRTLTTIRPLLAARALKGPIKPPPGITHDGECAKCHEPHAWLPDKEVCVRCHEKKVKTVAAVPNKPHSCLGCHEPHSKAPGAERCAECHAPKTAAQREAPQKHKDCLSCHNPHEARPVAQQLCGPKCHHDQQAALKDGQEKHRDCANCHTPHGNPKLSAPLRCKNCHEKPAQDFGTTNKHEKCSRCHNQHEFNKPAARSRCAECHKDKKGPDVPHKAECLKCHNNHLPGRGLATQCPTCHTDIHPQVPTHQKCNGCHKPHTKATVAITQCPTCHKRQGEAAASWPSNSPHAGRCAECHTKHDETKKRECGSCHKDKPNPTHMGVHPTCTGCHNPHLPVPSSNPARWWTRCATCHTQQASAAATGKPKHQLCANCHNNPGRKPKQCIECHTEIRKEGEHQQAKHDTCLNCHTKHGTTMPTRKACEACHKDRRTHFPDAPKCQTCHPFTKE